VLKEDNPGATGSATAAVASGRRSDSRRRLTLCAVVVARDLR